MRWRRVFWAALVFGGTVPAEGGPAPAPVPSAESAGRMTLPEGFRATLFASEPDVHQPIAFTIDPKGRLWVVECYAYPLWLGGPQREDRVLVFEDTDGDGRHDRRTVFWEGGTNLTGIALGFGGVWLCSTPNLLFIPDADGDDRPDGPPRVVLDGWDVKAQHNMFNALTWGPDGWLWGCNGIMSNSLVGKPGTPDERRTPINCGVWRYHPTRGTFEVVAGGTTNPWGLDFDARGEAFITNCVIPHLFHVVPGARFQRMYGQDFNPHAYELMPTCADHVHWDTVEAWSDIRRRGVTPTTDMAGGGHAHVGAMIYQGDNWPGAYRGGVFTCNVHGHRVNHDSLERSKSGYVAHHERDFLLANDAWFRGLELKYGPDGGVYVTDWSDVGECHDTDADNAHRENGRIYKITYGEARRARVDLAALDDLRLVAFQDHANEWYARTARRLLQERAAAGRDLSAARARLVGMLSTHAEASRRLRALWTLHAIGGVGQDRLVGLLGDDEEDLRAWAVRLLMDAGAPPEPVLARFGELAASDPSPKVKLALASAVQRLPLPRRWPIVEALAAGPLDPDDAPLVLLSWYGMEPLVPADPARATSLAERASVPKHRRFLARRLAAHDAPAALAALLPILDRADRARRLDLLAGLQEALRGRKAVPMPAGWPALYGRLSGAEDAPVREAAARLGLIFADPEAVAALQALAASGSADPEARRRTLEALAERRAPGTARVALALLDDPAVRPAAIRALAAFDDPATAEALLSRYPSLPEPERDEALATLSARPGYARALLDALGRGVVPRRDITATVARQILAFRDPELAERLERTWGTIRPTAAAKAELLSRYKALLAPDDRRAPDPARGRAVFNKTCLQCHRLFDAGGDVGPELTGSDRANPDYILENVLDPGAMVGRDFRLATVLTTDGRLLAGVLKGQDDASVAIQTPNERIVLPREDVEDLMLSEASMMPEGLLEKLTPDEVRDLLSYLASPSQVPAAEPE